MNLLTQPKNSNICGQTCVAMIANIDIESSIMIFGHNHGTKTKEVIKALNKLGITTKQSKLERVKKNKLPEGLLIAHQYRHWIVIDKGKIYDPSPYREMNKQPITSYLEINEIQEAG